MATTPIPMPQQAQAGNPATESEYLRTLLAQQANTTGMTQMAPSMHPTPPIQHQFKDPGQQEVSAFGPGQKGAHQRQSMQNLVKASQSLANQFGQEAQAKQNRQYDVVIRQYTDAVQGKAQAQAQIMQATQALKANPQDAQAQQQLKTAQTALQVNQTKLNDMSSDAKQRKVITKAFGIDDKNAGSPERQAAMKVLQDQSRPQTSATTQGPGGQTYNVQGPPGLNPQAAGILSQLPQTQQLSPQGQAQAQMRGAGITGAPATQGQLMHDLTQINSAEMTEAERQAKIDETYRLHGVDPTTKQPIPIEQLPVEQQTKIALERSRDSLQQTQKTFMQAKQQYMADPRSPQNQIAMLRASATMKLANARMLQAQVSDWNYLMHSQGVDAQGNPLSGAMALNGVPIGTAVASSASKIIQNQAQFLELDGAVDNLGASIKNMQASGASFNDGALVEVLTPKKDPGWIRNSIDNLAKSSLTPEQQEYARNVLMAQENIAAMRKAAGQSALKEQFELMQQTLPGATTPNAEQASRQMALVTAQMNRLQQGVPQINIGGKGIQSTKPAGTPMASPASTPQPAPSATPPKGAHIITADDL
jgi:hypothetical protein